MNKNPLHMILLVVIMPLIIAILLFSSNYTGKTSQKGSFVQPIISVTKLNLPIKSHYWHILYINKQKCLNQCSINAKQLKQLLNIHQTELNRLKLSIITQQPKEWRELLANLPPSSYAIISTSPNEILKKLKENNDIVVIVDPRGFIPLKYTGNDWPMKLNNDLKKLMKQSQIG